MGYKIEGANESKGNLPTLQSQHSGIQEIHEASDVAETIRELNDDTLSDDKFSSIDLKTRLAEIEIGAIIAVDSLVALDFLPTEVSFITRSKKRLNVSKNGQGRSEIVQVAQGINEQSQGKSMIDRLGNMFGGNR